MFRKTGVLLAVALVAGAVLADELKLAPDHPERYTVRKGDTLWDIAGRFLAEPWRWPELWEVNPQIENPHLIYPGDVLSLTWGEDGRPRLRVGDRGGVRPGDRTIKLSPEIRSYRREEAVRAIPLDAIRQFLSRPRVVTAEQIEAAPYIVSSQDQHLVNGAGGRVYVRGIESEDATRFSIYRSGEVYRDPAQGGRVIGYEALHVGDGVLERRGDPATVRIIRSNREVLIGDRLMAQSEDKYPRFIPHAPERNVDGMIIDVIDGLSQIGQHQIVVLNKGARAGLEPGHVLAIYQSGETVNDPIAGGATAARMAPAASEADDPLGRMIEAVYRDFRATGRALDRALGGGSGVTGPEVELPEERAGELMVFRTFDEVSYALVMHVTRPVHREDAVRNP